MIVTQLQGHKSMATSDAQQDFDQMSSTAAFPAQRPSTATGCLLGASPVCIPKTPLQLIAALRAHTLCVFANFQYGSIWCVFGEVFVKPLQLH